MIISLHHDVLGDVTVSYRRNSRNYTARWKNGSVYMSVPYGASSRQIVDILDRLAPRLVASRPSECSLHPGSVLDLDSLTIDIRKPASSFSARTMVSLKPPSADTAYKYRLTLTLADDVDTSSPSYPAFVSRAIISSLDPVAADILVNLGRRHADRVGDHPSEWRIGRGLRVLGTCTRSRIITLSKALLFLPSELRDYVVCHELAHLKVMDHSEHFHSVLGHYLPAERRYAAELRRFKWPIVR